MKILCVFGKYQYGDPSRGLGTEYAAFVPALEALGHTVVHFESWDRSRYANFAELNRALLATVEAERPDVLLAVQLTYELWMETLQVIGARGDVATLCWTTDDSWKYEQASRFLGRAFHAMTTTYPHVVPKYRRDGIPHVLLTQWAASSASLRPPLPATDCRYAVSFVGAAHGDRPQRVAALRELGIDVACFGYGWPAGSVDAADIPRIMRESVVSLNFSNSSGDNQIKARTFEVPGAGGFLLTEQAPGLEQFYEIGNELDTFGTLADLASKLRHYSANPAQRDAIARAGYERTCREHTYERRLEQALEFSRQARDAHFHQTAVRSVPAFEDAVRQHTCSLPLKALRASLVAPCTAIWGPQRGPRAARRIMFETSWRLFGAATFSARGWTGRMFPDQ